MTQLVLKATMPLFVLSATQRFTHRRLQSGIYVVHLIRNPFPRDCKQGIDPPDWWVTETRRGLCGMTPSAWIAQNVDGVPIIIFDPAQEVRICELVAEDLIETDEIGNRRIKKEITGYASTPRKMLASS